MLREDFNSPQKRVVNEESKLLSMMPLTTTSQANKTWLYHIQQEVSRSYLYSGGKDYLIPC